MDPRQLLESRSARALDEDESGRVLVASDLTGTFQLYELDGELRQLTDFAEPVSGRYLPGRRQAVVQIDRGGDERHQLYLLELEDPPGADRRRLRVLVESPDRVHRILGVSPDGRELAYASNERNGVDFDVFLLDLETGASRTVYNGGGWAEESGGYSPNGRYLSFGLPGLRPLDRDLVLADLETGQLIRPLPHPDEAALVGHPCFIGDHELLVSSNIGRDTTAVVWHDLSTGQSATLVEDDWDLDCFASPDGSVVLVVANVDGGSRAELFEIVHDAPGVPPVLKEVAALPLPGRGVIAGSLVTPPPLLAAGGSHVTYTYTSPVVPGDIWRVDRALNTSRRLTSSPGPDAELDGLVEPTTEAVTSFDGEQIPLFSYRPPGHRSGESTMLLPVVLVIHGGPESQSMLTFNPVVQALVHRGFGVVVPNVRGSTGYGKRYASLDDTTKRLDSVRDLAAIHGWLASAGFDPDRAALYGGSYGGYMVLAGVAFQPELWAAGVDIVGISDLVTFLENTSAYRRAFREREYGSLEHDRDFLASASPLRRADNIRAPLFVIHGENDPRVPVSEARQLVGSLERRGVPHNLMVFEDEGHGLAKLANRLAAYPAAIEFLAGHLGLDAARSSA
jgi:acetyl esterase/lipase